MIRRALTIGLVAGMLTAACERSQDPSARSQDKEPVDAGLGANVNAVDPSLAKAVQSMAKAAQAGPTTDQGGPPESGVFAPGQADKELPQNVEPRISVGSTGGAPKFVLARQPSNSKTFAATLRLRQMSGRQSLPPLNIGLELQAKPAAHPPATADAGTVPAPIPVQAKVKSVELESLGMPLPDSLKQTFATLVGSGLRFEIAADGGARNVETELAPKADPALKEVLEGIAGGLTLAFVPMPLEPIGAGGYFMVTSRDREIASDVLTYRMVRVEQISENAAKLTMTTRRYATDARVALDQPGPQGNALELAQYESRGEGSLELELAVPFAREAQVSHQLVARFAPAPGSQQQLGMQSMLQFQFSLDTKP